MSKFNYKILNRFINRKKEQDYFLKYFKELPRNILFIYGPKSTGKTTLIKKVIDELPQKEYDINFMNLRDYLITQFKDFKNLFFPTDLKGKLKGTKFNLVGFSWDSKEADLIEKNIFGLMKRKIEQLVEKGIKSVIIIDEFQYLKEIYLDDKKEVKLINELFKFFISITKQYNLAHVVCLTSDSYFLDELYFETKLKNTSKFYLVDHLNKADVYYWLSELEKCPKKMVDDIWKNLGGSVWEIWQVFVEWKNDLGYEDRLEDIKKDAFARAREVYENIIETEDEQKKYLKIIKEIVKIGDYEIPIGTRGIQNLIKTLVDKDLWFYNSMTGKVTANSESMRVGFKTLLKQLEKMKK